MKQKLSSARPPQEGAVLLIAMLVASVALSVGLGVYNRTYKELLFASFWKQTQVAFSAADSGLECALYWDTRPDPRPTTASCFGATVTGWNPSLNNSINLQITTPICVSVEITKNSVAPMTIISARGYNTCGTNNPRRVERGLRIAY